MSHFYEREIQKLIDGIKSLEKDFEKVAKHMDLYSESRAFEVEKVACKLHRLIDHLEIII